MNKRTNRAEYCDTSDARKRNSIAITTILHAFAKLPIDEAIAAALRTREEHALVAFMISGTSGRASDPNQLLSEFERHYAMTAISWHDAAEQLLLTPELEADLQELEERHGEPFVGYLRLDDAGVRERLDENYVAIETDRGIHLFHRLRS